MSNDFVLYRAPGPLGFDSILRSNNWLRHLLRHPELDGHLDDMPTLLSDPDVVVELADGSHHFYRAGLGTGKVADCFLYAVVREFATDDPGSRTVTSAYFTKVLKKGNIVWTRPIA